MITGTKVRDDDNTDKWFRSVDAVERLFGRHQSNSIQTTFTGSRYDPVHLPDDAG